jgi:hypothetical protein
MSERVGVIVSVAVIIAAFLVGGRYTAVGASRGEQTPIVYVLDKFTGNVWFCGGAVCRQSGPISN